MGRRAYAAISAGRPQTRFDPIGLDTDVQAYRWNGEEWEPAGGSGGGSWSDELRIHPPELDPDEVTGPDHGGYGSGDGEWVAGVADGVAGSDARSVEVAQDGRVVSRAIDSPLRAWVVAFDGRRPAVLRVRGNDEVLRGGVLEPVDW